MKVLNVLGIVVFLAGIGITAQKYGEPVRDKDLLHDIEVMARYISQDQAIGMTPDIRKNWSLMSYAKRYNGMSLERVLNDQDLGLCGIRGEIPEEYVVVPTEMKTLRLLKRKNDTE
jgi:hypothetical protein